MMTVPTLTQEQRREAFTKSLELRKRRADLKAYVAGKAPGPFDDWIRFNDALKEDAAQGMKVYDLVISLPGIGKAKAGYLLKSAGIPEKNTVRGCGPKQKERLLALLG